MIVLDDNGVVLPEPEKATPADLRRVLRLLPALAEDMDREPHSFTIAGPLLIAQYERVAELSEWVTKCTHALHDRLADDLHGRQDRSGES